MKAAASQLIYSWVKAAFSPKFQNGLQTVWKSPGLSPRSVDAIERRIQCFRPERGDGKRRQLFQLEDGAVVITESTSVTSHPEIIGQSRAGLFAVHCFIFDRAQFSYFGDDPFVAFQSCRFLCDLQTMVDSWGPATGVAPQVDIEPRFSHLPETRWQGAEAAKLMALALGAPMLRSRGQTVLLVGGQEEIEDAIRFVFALLPPARRLACSFSTAVDGCPVERGAYWAVGAKSLQAGGSFIAIDARQRRVAAVPGELEDDDGLYSRYLRPALMQGVEPEVLFGQVTALEAVLGILEGRAPVEKVFDVKGGALRDLLAWNAEEIRGRLLAAAATRVEGPAAQRLSELMREWLLQHPADLDRRELKNLQRLARVARDWQLLHWASTMGRKIWRKGREEALRHMTSRDYETALTMLGNPIPPDQFVSVDHLHTLLRHVIPEQLGEEDLVRLIEAISKIGAGKYLTLFTGQLGRIGPRSLARLHKATRRLDSAAAEFRQALESCTQRSTASRAGDRP